MHNEARHPDEFGDVPEPARAAPLPPALESALAALRGEANRPSSRSRLYDAFAHGVADALKADLAEVLEYLPGRNSLLSRATASGGAGSELAACRVAPPGLLSGAGRAFLDATGSVVILEDLGASPDDSHDGALRRAGALRALAVRVPAPARGFGVIAAYFAHPPTFGHPELTFLRRASDALGAGLERLADREALSSWRARTHLLHAGADLLQLPAAPESLLAAAAEEAVCAPQDGRDTGDPPRPCHPMADWCFADALVSDARYPVLRRVAVVCAGAADPAATEAFSVPLTPRARHGAPRAVRTRRPELVERVDERFLRELYLPEEAERRLRETRPLSYACVPVVGRSRTHGVLAFLRCEAGANRPYDGEDLAALARYAEILAAALDRVGARPEEQEVAEAEDAVRSRLLLAAEDGHRPADLSLTRREEEILALIAGGAETREIRSRLGISERTVKGHKTQIRRKAGYNGRNDMALIARLRRLGWKPQNP
jgi:DNA-binding CsgD family transcriptional regulator